MSAPDERRYGISDVSRMTGVAAHVLRQWEARIPQLKPERDRANRRFYRTADVEIVRRIKQLIDHEKLTTKGVRLRLSQELAGTGRPRTNREMVDLIDRIEAEARAALDLLDRDGPP